MDETEMPDGWLVASPDVLVQELPGGELIFLHLTNEQYFGLDPVGTRMYHRLIEAQSIHEARDQILDEFDVEKDRLTSDLAKLVDRLLEEGIVQFREP